MANVPPSSSSVPQTPYELAERVQISMAGFLFNKIRVRQLCIEAFKIPAEIVDREGPLTVATVYLDHYACLDSPSFISFSYYRKETPTIVRRGYVLVCRLAYVSPGLAVPALPFDARTQAYIERWFPQAIRSTVPFEGIQYLQVPYPSNQFPTGCVYRKMGEWNEAGVKLRTARLLRWLKAEKKRGIKHTRDIVPPLMQVEYIFDFPIPNRK